MIRRTTTWFARQAAHAGGSAADLAFIIADANRGWILDGICRDAGRHYAGRVAYHYGLEGLPRADAYFFSHFSLYLEARRRHLIPRGAKTLVYFTHPRDIGLSERRLAAELSRATAVLSMASMHSRRLIAMGVPAERVRTVLGAADPDVFTSHERGTGRVGFVSAYYPRKSPDTLIGLVRALPSTEFLLVGKGWKDSSVAGDLAGLPNIDIVERPYADYPSLYAQMDVFVSPSTLEGGPIPLLEAMMANVVPVSTRTGFAPDVIEAGVNGFLCDVGSPPHVVAALVERALEFGADVRSSVRHLDWPRYADCIRMAVDESVDK